ncbi:MAG: glycosyltransferase family 47 protein [Gammaproteobacteria bacterium]|nr:glycosyltransferase family 47 protein [Gammaproteobacteria bacterium]
MKIYLTSAYDVHNMLDALTVLTKKDVMARHTVCATPEEADIILFVEDAHFDDYLYKQLRLHPLVKQYPDKVFMYNELDKPWCVLPGLYSSMPRRYFQENRQVAFGFIHTPNDFVKNIYSETTDQQRRWLFSFVGAMSHRCRRHIMALNDLTPSVQDTSEFNVWDCTEDTKASQGMNYASVMAESQYVLCPRGIGTSSFRLFEAMEAGRAPVIISNQWVEPNCVNWDFAVRIPEHDIACIPDYLRSIADEAHDRGVAARAAWERTFAPECRFDTMIEGVGGLLESRKSATSAVHFQNFRKVLINGEVKFLHSARRMRDRLQHLSSDFSV